MIEEGSRLGNIVEAAATPRTDSLPVDRYGGDSARLN